MRRVLPMLLILLVTIQCKRQDTVQIGAQCFSISDCSNSMVCFLGNCVQPGVTISNVYVELTPPNDSPFLPQPYPNAIPSKTFQKLTLKSAIAFNGNVVEVSSDKVLRGELELFSESPIPGRDILYKKIVVTNDGFSTMLNPADYLMVFWPFENSGNDIFPPNVYPVTTITKLEYMSLWYPNIETVIYISGQLRYTESATETVVAGASIRAESIDRTRPELKPFPSPRVESNENGEFIISFLPQTQIDWIRIRPGTNPLIPDITFTNIDVDNENQKLSQDLVLLPHTNDNQIIPFGTGVRVINQDEKAVANATIYLIGSIGNGTLRLSATTDLSGNIPEINLLAGQYVLYIVPSTNTFQGMLYIDGFDPANADPSDLIFVLPDKVKLSGLIKSWDNEPLSEVNIQIKMLDTPVARIYETNSYALNKESKENFDVWLDPNADYELVLTPPISKQQPVYRQLLAIGQINSTLRATLSRPTFAYGAVYDEDNNVIPNVLLTFFSTELTSVDNKPLLVGITQSNELGEFVLPLPTPK